MNKMESLALVWRLEEILMAADHLERQVGNCGEQCGTEDEGLCPECCKALEKVIAGDKKLAENKELDNILKKLKRAFDGDMTGEYERILKQSRESNVFH